MARALLFLTVLGIGSCVFDSSPAPVLFLGNSITYSDTTAFFGFDHQGGMAASSREKDYVHQTIALLQTRGIKTEAVIGIRDCVICDGVISDHAENADWEVREFKPRFVVLQLGENSNDSEVAAGRLTEQYRHLLQVLTQAGAGKIFCFSAWKDTSLSGPRNSAIRAALRDFPGAKLVDITDVGKDPANSGDSGLYRDPSVLWHPGDQGMRLMAERLVEAFLEAP